MEENKELIYSVERVEPFDGVGEEALPAPERPAATVHPASARGTRPALLMVCVAIFAIAFLLCDAAYALRQTVESEGETADWLSGWVTGSLSAAQSTAPSDGSDRPDAADTTAATDGTAATEAVSESASDTSVSESETLSPPPPTLTVEELYRYDAAAVPSGMIPIVPMDLSLTGYGENFYYNDTSYQPVLNDLPLSQSVVPTMAGAGQVSVLIVHTHATEGYSEEGAAYYDPSTTLARADDPDTGVIAVGDVIAEILNQNGIVTLHSTVLHDKDSYKDSYSRSAQTIKSYLEQYPSIRLVIDVHRDSILTSSDQLVRPVTLVDGEAVAQVMCVVGSNAAGGAYDHWRDNLSLAVGLRRALNGTYDNLCRPIYIKKSTYNQQYAPASLLLEIGSSGNTLAEAQRAAALVAEQIVGMMK